MTKAIHESRAAARVALGAGLLQFHEGKGLWLAPVTRLPSLSESI